MRPIKAWAVLITDKKGRDHIYRPNGRMFISTKLDAEWSAKATTGDCYFRAVAAHPVRVTITVEE